MNTTNHHKNGRGLFSLFRRGEVWKEIAGYHVGDIQENMPVAVTPGATLVGNIFAPKITVAGLLYGSTASRETTIESQGQIWGDVYTGRFHIEPGGKFQGWVSNLDEEGYQTLQAEGVIPREIKTPVPGPFELPADVLEGSPLIRSESQINVLRRLQVESAAALAARAELEQTFERRLSEVAGETSARANSLHEELNVLRLELTNMRQHRDELQEELHSRNAKIDRQTNELTIARDVLSEQTEELNELRQKHERHIQEFQALTQTREILEADLHQAHNQIETLTDRIRSIETALQASLQHSSEQEESLVRWQELAEVTESRVQTLQTEIDSLKFQATESTRVVEVLRAQRKQAEEAWQEAVQELEALREKETRQLITPEALSELEQLKTDLEEAQDQNKQHDLQLVNLQSTHKTQMAQLQTAYEERLAELEETIEELQQAGQQHQEVMLWNKANLESLQIALEQEQATSEQQKEELERLRAQLQEKQEIVAHLQQEDETERTRLQLLLTEQEMVQQQNQETITSLEAHIEQLQTEQKAMQTLITQLKQEKESLQHKREQIAQTLTQQEQQLADAQTRIKQLQKKAAVEQEKLQTTLRQIKSQLEAQETETENYLQQMQTQGTRLADLHSALVERDIQLQQLKTTAEKQAQFIKRMKEVTTERIDSLKTELTHTKKQLRDAIAVINRRQTR